MKIKAGGTRTGTRTKPLKKVFIVVGEWADIDGYTIYGVFTSRLLAETCVQALNALWKDPRLEGVSISIQDWSFDTVWVAL